MKNSFRKFLFGDSEIREFVPIAMNGSIREQTILLAGRDQLNVSDSHWLLALDPVVFGFWFTDAELIGKVRQNIAGCTILFCDSLPGGRKEKVASARLSFFDTIEERDGTLFLFSLKESSLFHLDALRTMIMYRKYYRKPNLNWFKFKALTAAHSYPRRVRIISVGKGKDYNIFPMDLLGNIAQQHRFIFGLRHSNRSLPEIIGQGKLVVSEASPEHKTVIYQLGKHHLSNPPLPEKLPFGIIESENYGFYVPDWVDNYKEVTIKKAIDLGSHMLLWGTWDKEKIFRPETAHLYHIHFLQYLHQKRKGINYQIV